MQQEYIEQYQKLKNTQNIKERSFIYNSIISILKNYKFRPQSFQGDELYQILTQDIMQILQQQKAIRNTLIYLNAMCLTLQQFVSTQLIKNLYNFVCQNIITIDNYKNDDFYVMLKLLDDIFQHLETSKFDPRKDELDIFEVNDKNYNLKSILLKLNQIFNQVSYDEQHIILNIMYVLIQRSPTILYKHINLYLTEQSLPIKYLLKDEQEHFIISLLIFSSSIKELSGYFSNATVSESLNTVKSDEQGQQVLLIYQIIQKITFKNQEILLKAQKNKDEIIISRQILKSYEQFLQQVNIYKMKLQFDWVFKLNDEELKLKYLQVTLKSIIDQIECCPMCSNKIQQFWIDLINKVFQKDILKSLDILVYYYQNKCWENIDENNQYKIQDNVQNQTSQDIDFNEIFDQKQENQKYQQYVSNNQYIYNATNLIATYLSIYPTLPCLTDMFGQNNNFYKQFYIDIEQDDIYNKFTYVMQQMIQISQQQNISKNQKLLILKYLITFTYTYQNGINIHLQEKQSNISKLQIKFINHINNQYNLNTLQLNFVTRYLNEQYQSFIVQNVIISANNQFYDQIQFQIIGQSLPEIIDQIQPEQYSLLTDTVNAELDYFIQVKYIKESLNSKLIQVIQAHQTLIKLQYFVLNELLIQQAYDKYYQMLNGKNIPTEIKKHILQNIQVIMIYTDKCCPQNVLNLCLQLASRYSRCQSEALRVFRYIFRFLDLNLQIYDIDIQQIIQSFVYSLSTNEQTAYTGIYMFGVFYQYVELYQQGKQQQKCQASENTLIDLVEQTFKSVTDKLFDYLNLYPKTLTNQMRSNQIIKQLTCINKTLALLPSQYIQQQRIFATVSYCYNEFSQIFNKQYGVMFDSQNLLLKLIQTYMQSNYKLKIRGNVQQLALNYIEEQIRQIERNLQEQAIFKDESVDVENLQQKLRQFQQIKQNL